MHLTYTRSEWSAIADKVAASDRQTAPPGLAERIAALLDATPEGWPNQPCVLELTPEAADVVRLVARKIHMVSGAESIVQEHQRGNATASHRIEHRSGGISSVVAYLSSSSTLRQELAQHAARLRRGGSTGEVVLVLQASNRDVARLPLLAEPDTGPDQA